MSTHKDLHSGHMVPPIDAYCIGFYEESPDTVLLSMPELLFSKKHLRLI